MDVSKLADSRSCKRFKPRTFISPSAERAMVFLDLRRKGCERNPAMKFSKKPLCRTDITKKKDGPSECKELKQINSYKFAEKGWTISDPEYEMGHGGYFSHRKYSQTENSEEFFINHLKKNEKQMKADFKKKIELSEKYYCRLNDIYNFSKLPEKKLLKKLQELRSEKPQDSKKKKIVKISFVFSLISRQSLHQ